MSDRDPDLPVFVDDSGARRRMTAAVAATVTAGAVAVTATICWAVFTSAPVGSSTHPNAVPPGSSATTDTTPPSDRSGPGADGPFAVDTTDRSATVADAATECTVVRGTVFNDLDLNGSRQPETEGPLPGVLVELTDVEGNVNSTLTGTDGSYTLTPRSPGPSRLEFRGRVEEFIPTPVGLDVAAWVSFPRGGPVCEVDTSALWTGWFAQPDQLSAVVTREIGDRVWHDVDGDGVQDPGEPGLAGVDLALLDASGRRRAVTTTSPDGHYRFSGLAPDQTYRVALASVAPFVSGPLAGLTPTTPWAGTTAEVSPPGATDRDSGHVVTERGDLELLIPPDEPGASRHSYDLGFRPA